MTVDAIYENGVLRPLEPLDLPERLRVRLTIAESNARPEDVALLIPSEEWTQTGSPVELAEVRRLLSGIQGSLSEAIREERDR